MCYTLRMGKLYIYSSLRSPCEIVSSLFKMHAIQFLLIPSVFSKQESLVNDMF